MTEQRHLIWSNYDLDYEDWRDDLEEDHPELTEDERMALMYEINNRYLDDERVNLNIQLDQPILVIADLGLWNGRRTGYQEISSGNIRDCLYSGRDIEYATWYVDKLGDLRCDAIHHDGTNHLLYRTYKPGARDSQIDLLKEKTILRKGRPHRYNPHYPQAGRRDRQGVRLGFSQALAGRFRGKVGR